ncbi:MAG: beta-ketoacyl-[acyl-carrier-protein] synthase family protein [Acidobacteriota bacterium]
MRRVAITGLGSVSALGIGVPAFWDSLIAARSGVRWLTLIQSPTASTRIAAEVQGFEPQRWMSEDKQSLMDRFAQFAVAAASEAIGDAGLDFNQDQSYRAGVSIGTGSGGAGAEDDAYLRLYRDGATRLHPFTIPRLMYNSATAHVGMMFGLRGPSLCYSTACASGTHAIGEAAEIIRSGRADVMVAGGADAPISEGVVKAWEAMRVLAPSPPAGPAGACRPFSRDRRGIVLGEGAGIVVLEEWEHARARGAHIHAELAGYGATADAGHITQPGVESPARAITLALAQARLMPDAVGYVNAHGTATPLNDETETTILKRVFGAHASKLAISSTKSMHGHAMGASGALELVATVLAIERSTLPPTANYTEPDPACDLDYVPNHARDQAVDAAISNSFAFGGLNAVLAVRRVG